MSVMRLLESMHGHMGVLAAVALLHPAILLRKGKALSQRTALSVWLTAMVVVSAFTTGLVIYPAYRQSVRADLFAKSVTAGFLFETKEHIAYAVVALTLGATVAALAAPKEARRPRRLAAVLFALAAAVCLLTVGLGSYLVAVQDFS